MTRTTMHAANPPQRPWSRHELLTLGFPLAMTLIRRNHADEVEQGFIADYLALSWLVRAGDGFQITDSGTSVCVQVGKLARRGRGRLMRPSRPTPTLGTA